MCLLPSNPSCSFPTIIIDGQTIIGFKVQEIKDAIGVRTKVDDLHDMLKKVQEPESYFFNRDRERTFDLLRGLLTNKKRYGYMCCPCEYRAADLEEFGACYCQPYVLQEWNEERIPHVLVPERRPADRYLLPKKSKIKKEDMTEEEKAKCLDLNTVLEDSW